MEISHRPTKQGLNSQNKRTVLADCMFCAHSEGFRMIVMVSCFPKDETSFSTVFAIFSQPSILFYSYHHLITFCLSPSESRSFSSCKRQLPGLEFFLSLSRSLFIPPYPPPHPLIDREQSPSSKQESDGAGGLLSSEWQHAHTHTHTFWQRLGRRQSGHCFNDHRLFSSLAFPSTSVSSLPPLLIVDGRSFIGPSEFQKPNYRKLLMSKEWQLLSFILFEIILGLEF